MSAVSQAIKRITPLLDRVLVRRVVAPTQSAGGVLLPESAQQRLNQGVVVSVGPGRLDKDGNRIAMSVHEGDNVLLPEYGGNAVEIGSDKMVLFRDEDILGVINE